MTNGEKHIETLLSWYKEAVTEDGVCYLTSVDKNTLAYAIKCCKFLEDIKKDIESWGLREEPSGSEKPNKTEISTGSDDCVSRQAVEDAMYDATRAMDLNYGQIMDYIDNLPPAIPIRPKGRWIKVELPSRDAHECSECGNLALVGEDGNEQLTDFCPNCGSYNGGASNGNE
jgi:hypothetical protein